ncbi:pyruvate decarboxylase [Verminephrobacter eiseniae]|uniref:thiamine pyrophosphate-dependent enzyme n=1 Tax=Verminephrobacter eiseniae TaxID=364317 RepID=UPI002238E320|nr:thiamine pyrophosphate-dependent enzyme [Verminephrobacter eiseniae]MCW5261502.1 pyruvate decarboxylase [Verminephrobacter eiseniae]
MSCTSSHALLRCLADNGVDRVFVVPGESYLGVLDALSDFDGIDVVTCRHESGAAFMAAVDGRLTGRPGVAMVSRGPGATNAAIGIHAAQQDAAPMILVIGQVPKKDLRKEAFQEIDYQQMFGSLAKWVCEVTAPEDLAAAAFKAVRVALSGLPGPVVLVIPEDIQQQQVAVPQWVAVRSSPTQPDPATVRQICRLLQTARRPLIIAGSALDRAGGREALLDLATQLQIPVAVSFRGHDLFPNQHALFAGDLGLANPAAQIAAFAGSDLILALGTRLGDITTQGYRFPACPRPTQTLVHCIPDAHYLNQHFVADIGVVADPVATLRAILAAASGAMDCRARAEWAAQLNALQRQIAAWPTLAADDGIPFVDVVRCLHRHAPGDLILCLDAGSFAAPVYRHFPFTFPQRLMASLSGAMGYGTPAAVAAQLRRPAQKVVCLVGDGGFLMTGNEMVAAIERQLPILFIVANNHCYGSIRIHQERSYPARSGRHAGTRLSNPDFVAVARAFGMAAEHVASADQVEAAVSRGLRAKGPYFIDVETSLSAVLPADIGGQAGAVLPVD